MLANQQLVYQNTSTSGHTHIGEQSRFQRAKSPESQSTQSDLILIRGLPGSGKSTMAIVLKKIGFKHFEADMFFEVNGSYEYDKSKIKDAHAWCQEMTRNALQSGHKVVVSNTFTRLSELEIYKSMTSKYQIIEANGKWKNIHSVPAYVIQNMAQRWEPLH